LASGRELPQIGVELAIRFRGAPPDCGGGNTASAMLRGDAAPGLVLYDVYCNDQLATGGSSPGLIIDP